MRVFLIVVCVITILVGVSGPSQAQLQTSADWVCIDHAAHWWTENCWDVTGDGVADPGYPDNSTEFTYQVSIPGSTNMSVRISGHNIEVDSVSIVDGHSTPTSSIRCDSGWLTIVNSQPDSGWIENDSLIRLDSVHWDSQLRFDGDVSITGDGAIEMTADIHNSIRGVHGTEIVYNHSNHSFRGAAWLGADTLLFHNSGTIEAYNGAMALEVDPRDTGVNINDGSLLATGAGTLRLNTGIWDNSFGVVHSSDDSRIEIADAELTGGTLATSDNGVIDLLGGSAIADLSNTGLVQLTNTHLSFSTARGTITNDGVIHLASVHWNANLRLDGDVTLDGSGELLIGADEHNSVDGAAADDRLVNGSGHTIRGAAALGCDQMALSNHGLIEADSPVMALFVDLSDGADNVNTGTMRATNGATLHLYTSSYSNAGASILADDGSTVVIEGATIVGGTLASTGSGVIELHYGASLDGLSLTQGRIHLPQSRGASYLDGTVTSAGTVEVGLNSALTSSGIYQPLAGSTTVVTGAFNASGLTVMAGTLAGTGEYSGDLALAPTAVLAPGSSVGTLTTGDLSIQDGAEYDWQSGALTADLVDVHGALDFATATLTLNPSVVSGPPPTEMVIFEYDTLSTVPNISQIELTNGWSYTGLSIQDNRITLTGVNSGLIFADGFESGDTGEWSHVVPARKSMTRHTPPFRRLEPELRAPALQPNTPAELVRFISEDPWPLRRGRP